MGAGGSKSARGAISDPFPVSQKLSKDLDKLSYVAARILSTPDIYDVNNLARPGVCGDYAVFLKKGLEKKLLPFIVDLSGEKVEVVYQNPRKAITDLEKRKKICGEMADTMLRAIATILACLASIQVATQSREAAVAPVPKQTGGTQFGELPKKELLKQYGGSVISVRDWFQQAGYISAMEATKTAGTPMYFQVPGIPSNKFKFRLTLDRTEGNLTYGLISVESPGATDPLPTGSLRVQFLNQVALPIPGITKSVLPMRIVDNAGLPWAAGIFYESVFKSFVAEKGQYYITEMFEQLFRRTQGVAIPALETREQIQQANEVFQQLRRTQNPQVVFQTLGQWFAQHISGFQAGYVAPQPAYVAPPPYGALPPYGAPPPYGVPPAYGIPPQPIRPLQPVQSYGYGQGIFPGTVSLRPSTGDVSYDIPLTATKGILDTLKLFRDLIPKQSSPAAVRASTLAAKENPDRTVQTGVCRDPYWLEPNLSKIYPWATFQFLCIQDWKFLGEDRSRMSGKADFFHPQWTAFLDRLGRTYDSTGPTLVRTAGANFLDQLKFTNITGLLICKENQNPRVKFAEVQEGLVELQELHERHVSSMWKILNDLIFVIVDPETKTEVVRLNPAIVSLTSNKSSKQYVDDKANEARDALMKFYSDVEDAYMRAVRNLVSV